MSVEYKDYYKILGVGKEADKDEISRAYKKLARKYHPDLNPGNAQAEEKFKEVTEAYEVLKDDEKRKLYDQLGPNWQQAQQGGFGGGNPFGGGTSYTFNGQSFDGSQFSDFFETLFGGGRRSGRSGFGGDPFGGFSSQPQAGRDVEADVQITLEDAVKGGERSISLQTGEGTKNLKVNIPAGVKDGARLRLAGQGYASPSGGPRGDLYLRVRFAPHSLFHVDGKDLTYEAELDPWQGRARGEDRGSHARRRRGADHSRRHEQRAAKCACAARGLALQTRGEICMCASASVFLPDLRTDSASCGRLWPPKQ